MKKVYIIALILFLLLVFCLNAGAKSYTLDKAEVYYKIMPNGMVEASEKITFDFDGSFSFAYRDIPKGQWLLENVAVFDVSDGSRKPVKFETIDQGSDTRIKLYYDASNFSYLFCFL